MKLLCHHERDHDGLLLYEAEAETRIMSVFGNSKNGFTPINMPYMIFVVRYEKPVILNTEDEEAVKRMWGYNMLDLFHLNRQALANSQVIYPGVSNYGLKVFCREAPIQSVNDPVLAMPTDPSGNVCTDHSMDQSLHESPELLAKKIIGSWYSLQHSINCLESKVYRSPLGPLNNLLRYYPHILIQCQLHCEGRLPGLIGGFHPDTVLKRD